MVAGVSALKKYASQGDALRDFSLLQAHLKAETDRSAVVILCSYVEDRLALRLNAEITKRKSKTSTEQLFDWNGPLGTFSARIEIAHAFGILEDLTWRQLTRLRHMRNACAHSAQAISFDVEELRAVAEEFAFGQDALIPAKYHQPTKLRDCFTSECVMVATAIRMDHKRALARYEEVRAAITKRRKSTPKGE